MIRADPTAIGRIENSSGVVPELIAGRLIDPHAQLFLSGKEHALSQCAEPYVLVQILENRGYHVVTEQSVHPGAVR